MIIQIYHLDFLQLRRADAPGADEEMQWSTGSTAVLTRRHEHHEWGRDCLLACAAVFWAIQWIGRP